MSTIRNSVIALCMTAMAFSWCGFDVRGADDTSSVSAILAKAAQAPLSPALEQIVKLTKGGVAESVTLAFIQTSPTPYALDAQDIIRLREQGVSSQVITAMLQRNEEIRRATEEASQTAQSVASASAASPSQVVSAPAQTPVVYAPAMSYPPSTVSVTYFGSRAYDYNPGYWGYRSGFSGGYYPGYSSYACVPRYGYGYYGSRFGFGAGYSRGYGYCR